MAGAAGSGGLEEGRHEERSLETGHWNVAATGVLAATGAGGTAVEPVTLIVGWQCLPGDEETAAWWRGLAAFGRARPLDQVSFGSAGGGRGRVRPGGSCPQLSPSQCLPSRGPHSARCPTAENLRFTMTAVIVQAAAEIPCTWALAVVEETKASTVNAQGRKTNTQTSERQTGKVWVQKKVHVEVGG